MTQNNAFTNPIPDHTLSDTSRSSRDFFSNDFSFSSSNIKPQKGHLEDIEDFLEMTRGPELNTNNRRFLRPIPLTKLRTLLPFKSLSRKG